MDPKALQGRWLDQKQDSFLDFTASGLCAEVSKAPDSLVVFRWECKSNRLTLTPMCNRFFVGSRIRVKKEEEQTWNVEMSGDTLKIYNKKGQRRRFKKVVAKSGNSDLAGLWQLTRPDGKVDYFEFTPWGDQIGLGWFPPYGHKARTKMKATRAPEWASYTAVGDELALNGYSPFRRGRQLRVNYKREGSSLTFTPTQMRGVKPRFPYTLTLAERVER